MRNTITFLLLFFYFFSSPHTQAQSAENKTTPFLTGINYKFGKIAKEELELTSYMPDSTAKAVYIIKQGEMDYEYINELVLITSYYCRIKLLKDNAEDLANIEHIYYNSEHDNKNRDRITELKGASYNLENGKIIKSKLEKKYIYKEQIDENYYRLKFSLPNAKKGTVFEYKLSITSNRIWVIPSWDFQEKIPVDYTVLETTFPSFAHISPNMQGWQQVFTKSRDLRDMLSNNNTGYTKDITYSAYQVPALKKEPHMWCLDNYCSRIHHNLIGVTQANRVYKNFAGTWDKVRNEYYGYDSFGGNIKKKNQLNIQFTPNYLAQHTIEEKALDAFNLVTAMVKWDGNYELGCKDLKEVIKSGKGSNAAINFLVIRLLREWNIEAIPVVLCSKDKGLFPYIVMDNVFDTFIVAIKNGSDYLYMDGSNKYGYFNLLPPELSVEKALMMPKKGPTSFVNLEYKKKSHYMLNSQCSINNEGLLSGKVRITSIGHQAVEEQEEYQNIKTDSLEQIESMEKKNNFTLLSYGPNKFSRKKSYNQTEFTFEKELQVAGDRIYINPIIIKQLSEQPFKAKTRKYPIEFRFTERVLINNTIDIPEGYVVEELPEGIHTITEGKKIDFMYKATLKENILHLSYCFQLNKMMYLPQEYTILQQFWTQLVKYNNTIIVLKKKEQ